MTQPSTATDACLFTVGHSNHSQEAFLDLLKRQGIQVLVDTRSSPYSRYATQFNRETIAAAVTAAGIKYLFLGRELGGRPEAEEFYDDQGYVLYHRLAESPVFLTGIERLEKGIRQFRVAIMCSEENPAGCHRHLLVGRVMAARGHKLCHIRGDGLVQSDADLLAADNPDGFTQGFLFEVAEETPWRSLRPIGFGKQQEDLPPLSEEVPSR